MPNTSSAKKALRQNIKRRLRNRAARSALRTELKKCRLAAVGDDRDAAQAAYRTAARTLDQAAAKRLIHKNKAARLKSRLSALMKKGSGTPPAAQAAPAAQTAPGGE